MTERHSKWEAFSYTIVELGKWIEYAPFFTRSLGLTELEDIIAVNAIGCTVRDDKQTLEFVLDKGDHNVNIHLSYVLVPNQAKINLEYTLSTNDK